MYAPNLKKKEEILGSTRWSELCCAARIIPPGSALKGPAGGQPSRGRRLLRTERHVGRGAFKVRNHFRNLIANHSLFHPTHCQQIIRGSKQPVPNPVMAVPCPAWVLSDWHLSHGE